MRYIYLFVLIGTTFAFSSCDESDTVCTETSWYADSDEDGLGDPDVSTSACEQPDGYVADSSDTDDSSGTDNYVVNDVNGTLFLADDLDGLTVTIVDCTLSDGTSASCYQIVTNGVPEHEMGPWCPDNISDDATAGGIWLEDGEVHDVDGEFIKNMASFYNDDTWLMYDDNGDIYKTETEDDCINAANPNVGTEYENYCVECLPSYVTDVSHTYLIPITPVLLDEPLDFGGGPGATGPSNRGIAFNGIVFDAPAPTDAILGAYTLAPFDDAGGHINFAAGYHYHAANGVSTEIDQDDEHSAMIGYAMDGHGMYKQLDDNGDEPIDLDDCRGHYDETRGYHYHVDAAGNNNFIDCLAGAYAN